MLLLFSAWVCDDAYITFRTVDNFHKGYGLTWNVNERVQVYTHPLWMTVMTTIYFYSREVYFSVIALSLILSLLVVLIISFKLSASDTMAVLTIFILVSSKSFVDYSTSGMENPLTHLLLVLFFLIFIRSQDHKKKCLLLSLVAGMAILNRMDTVLFYIPALLVLAMQKSQRLKNLLYVTIGFIPFLLWELFAIFYYGFPFPNTAYAKLGAGVSRIELLREGIRYSVNFIKTDPVSFSIILFVLVAVILLKRRNLYPLAAGLTLYLIYILLIGGDFMSGRFFSGVVLGAVCLLGQLQLNFRKVVIPLYVVVISMVVISPYSPIKTIVSPNTPPREGEIKDEKAYHLPKTGLINTIKNDWQLAPEVWKEGLRLKKLTADKPGFYFATDIGFKGFYAGQNVYILDYYALANVLLARLPCVPDWRIGHFRREIPDGYVQTLQSGVNVIRNPQLSKYFEKIKLITRGNLLSWQRIAEIIKINFGFYDHLLDSYK
jgi:arabinofuranosyltransferase